MSWSSSLPYRLSHFGLSDVLFSLKFGSFGNGSCWNRSRNLYACSGGLCGACGLIWHRNGVPADDCRVIHLTALAEHRSVVFLSPTSTSVPLSFTLPDCE